MPRTDVDHCLVLELVSRLSSVDRHWFFSAFTRAQSSRKTRGKSTSILFAGFCSSSYSADRFDSYNKLRTLLFSPSGEYIDLWYVKQVALLRVTNGRESSRGFKLKYGFTGKSRGSRVSLFTRAARLGIYCCRFKKETGDARGSCKSSNSVGQTPSSRNSFRAPVFSSFRLLTLFFVS